MQKQKHYADSHNKENVLMEIRVGAPRRESSMSFPRTRAEMETAGYSLNEYTRCKGCMRLMEFWNTPDGKRIPMDPMDQPESAATSHFATCPEAHRFRRKRGPQ